MSTAVLGPAGSHEVIVIAGANGKARFDAGTVEFTYEFSVSGIDPTQGSVAGESTWYIIYYFITY